MVIPDEVIIELVGKHLKVSKHPTLSKKDPTKPKQITWRYAGPDAKLVRFWFPDEEEPINKLLWKEDKTLRKIDLTKQKTLTLTLHDECEEGFYPHAIFCDVEVDRNNQEFTRPGHQMVEGRHSHPDHEVGP
jgi:hypothetical protein